MPAPLLSAPATQPTRASWATRATRATRATWVSGSSVRPLRPGRQARATTAAGPALPPLTPSPVLGIVGLAALAALVVALLIGSLAPAAGRWRGVGPADGRIGDRVVTAFDVNQPAIARLDSQLRSALQSATRAAARSGIDLRVNSGWRSRAYQQELLDRAVSKYGSLREAERWVDTPATSAHVTGQAVDVGPPAAATWLDTHGSAFGLCRVYRNEPWHFERLASPAGTCPALQGDAA